MISTGSRSGKWDATLPLQGQPDQQFQDEEYPTPGMTTFDEEPSPVPSDAVLRALFVTPNIFDLI